MRFGNIGLAATNFNAMTDKITLGMPILTASISNYDILPQNLKDTCLWEQSRYAIPANTPLNDIPDGISIALPGIQIVVRYDAHQGGVFISPIHLRTRVHLWKELWDHCASNCDPLQSFNPHHYFHVGQEVVLLHYDDHPAKYFAIPSSQFNRSAQLPNRITVVAGGTRRVIKIRSHLERMLYCSGGILCDPYLDMTQPLDHVWETGSFERKISDQFQFNGPPLVDGYEYKFCNSPIGPTMFSINSPYLDPRRGFATDIAKLQQFNFIKNVALTRADLEMVNGVLSTETALIIEVSDSEHIPEVKEKILKYLFAKRAFLSKLWVTEL